MFKNQTFMIMMKSKIFEYNLNYFMYQIFSVLCFSTVTHIQFGYNYYEFFIFFKYNMLYLTQHIIYNSHDQFYLAFNI